MCALVSSLPAILGENFDRVIVAECGKYRVDKY